MKKYDDEQQGKQCSRAIASRKKQKVAERKTQRGGKKEEFLAWDFLPIWVSNRKSELEGDIVHFGDLRKKLKKIRHKSRNKRIIPDC